MIYIHTHPYGANFPKKKPYSIHTSGPPALFAVFAGNISELLRKWLVPLVFYGKCICCRRFCIFFVYISLRDRKLLSRETNRTNLKINAFGPIGL